jgi:hypothetical protein
MSISVLIRLAALFGALFILAAAIISAFSFHIAHRLKRPFTTLHHPLAVAGIALIMTHLILVATQFKGVRILIPNFTSWSSFWTMAGCPAVILFVLAIMAALLMRHIPRIWRWGHWLIYPAMLMAGLHGVRIGQDMRNPLISILLGTLLVAAIAVFVFKRLKKPSS